MINRFLQERSLIFHRPAPNLQRLLCNVLRSSLVVFFFCGTAFANNLVISNVSLEDRNASANTVVVEFDISWDHSWRKSDGRHDAAWVFVKLLDGNTGTPSYPWLHGKLYTAGTNPNDGTSVGTNSDIEIVVPSDKIGAFIRRRVTGNGTLSSQNVRLVVDYGTAGAADGDTITAKVYGIEMVYIPEGPFYIGDGDAATEDPNDVTSTIYEGADAFISKFDSGGTFQWAERLGGTGTDSAVSITVDGSSGVIVAGSIDGAGDLSGDGDTSDSNEGTGGVYSAIDGFVSKFNSSGTFQWSERLGGTDTTDTVSSVARDSSHNIYAAGYVTGNADLSGDADTGDTSESGNTGVYADGDIFISKFNSAGTFQWSERLGGTYYDYGYYVDIDISDNVLLTGLVFRNGDLTGDADTGDSNEAGQTGVYADNDIFITKFNSAGTFQWAERLGGTGDDVGYAVSSDGIGNVIVAGTASRSVDLSGDADTADSGEAGQTGVYAGLDGFISVFNSAGTFQWAKRLGGTTNIDNIYAVDAASNYNIALGGSTSGNADFNGDADTADSNETGGGVYGNNDGFVSVFNSAGTFQWSKRLAGTGVDSVLQVRWNSNSGLLVLGYVSGNADLNGDGDTGDTNETGNSGVYVGVDIFISVFDSAGTFQWSERLGGTETDYGYALNVDSIDNILMGGIVNGDADLNGDADAGSESTYALHQSGVDNTAVQITTTATSITVDSNSNDDIDTSAVSVDGDGGLGEDYPSWPVGYNDFYLMKYEITQQQYRDFLNTLDRTQQGTRVGATVSGNTIANYYVMSNGTTVSGRQGIRAPASGNGTSPTQVVFGNDLNDNGTFNEADDGMNIAMNWINWPDFAAYTDWAGLRPATELEFEKAARGPNSATYAEYAWGSTITQATSISNSGRVNEVAGNTGNGLAVFNGHASVAGPLRVGFAATNATSRQGAGAGYYGNMELSGNVRERAVTLGNSTGRAFTGTHGDGVLTTTASFEGNATNNDWPGIDGTTNKGVTAGTGGGWRGGSWNDAGTVLYVADRNTATGGSTTRDSATGGRAARTAP